MSDMNSELKELLSGILPTCEFQIPAGLNACISYQMYYANDSEYESGEAVEEHEAYRVTLWQKVEDKTIVKTLTKALRAAGWVISYRESMIDAENKYYQHVYNVEKWRKILNEHHS